MEPVCNMASREELMKQIMEIDFVLKDLNLYLDTHPCCEQAMCLYNEFTKKCKKLKNIYAENYGPITVDQVYTNTWDWIKNPWPWERMV